MRAVGVCSLRTNVITAAGRLLAQPRHSSRRRHRRGRLLGLLITFLPAISSLLLLEPAVFPLNHFVLRFSAFRRPQVCFYDAARARARLRCLCELAQWEEKRKLQKFTERPGSTLASPLTFFLQLFEDI